MGNTALHVVMGIRTHVRRMSRASRDAAVVLIVSLAGCAPAAAEKIEAALARAYQNNPQLNAQRATVRQTDENVPQALSGYRPNISANVSAGKQFVDARAVIVTRTGDILGCS